MTKFTNMDAKYAKGLCNAPATFHSRCSFNWVLSEIGSLEYLN